MNIKVVFAIAETIRDLGEVPSGHLYAQLMGNMSLDQYNRVIATLKGAGVVEEKAFLLKWIGPKAPVAKTATP